MSELMLSKIGKSGVEFPLTIENQDVRCSYKINDYATSLRKDKWTLIGEGPYKYPVNKEKIDWENYFVLFSIPEILSPPSFNSFGGIITGKDFNKEFSVNVGEGNIIFEVQSRALEFQTSDVDYLAMKLDSNYPKEELEIRRYESFFFMPCSGI